VRDVLEVFGLGETRARPVPVEGEARVVLERLSETASTADELARATGLEPGRLAATLVELELAGAAHEADGVYRAVVGRG
jgi:predicted Rossmann fold nucleotide-binding protein DprA/Smf involved in DNA uptake